MAEVQARLKNIRFSAQKGRLVADQVRGMSALAALDLLAFSPKRAAKVIKKVLESAVANAEHNNGVDVDVLRVSSIFVDEGTTMKRHRARAKGRGAKILKRGCHVTVKVSDNLGENR